MHKQRSLKPEALALAAGGLSADEVEGVEHGKREPTLSELPSSRHFSSIVLITPEILQINDREEPLALPAVRSRASRRVSGTAESCRVGWCPCAQGRLVGDRLPTRANDQITETYIWGAWSVPATTRPSLRGCRCALGQEMAP